MLTNSDGYMVNLAGKMDTEDFHTHDHKLDNVIKYIENQEKHHQKKLLEKNKSKC